jgi:uncharacterized membrane protein
MLGAFGFGLGVAYLFDIDAGRRRRAMLRDKGFRGAKSAGRGIRTGARDLSHRAKGLAAEARHLVDREEPMDEVIEARVRSQIGRLVSHPHAVRVSVLRGVVTLSGDVLPGDARTLMEEVPKFRGVKHVEDRFSVYCNPEHVPSLQGGRTAGGQSRESWKPSTRLAVIALSGISRPFAFRRGGWLGAGVLAAGGLLTIRALTNKPLRRVFGFGGRRLVELHKRIEIDAPIERVFAHWSQFEHFPEFMSHVREVKELGHGRSRWTVAGPFGAPVSWTAEMSAFRPNELLAWRSANGSVVKHSGIVVFESWGDGTKLEIQMTYNPPGGLLGHAMAWLFRKDPKHALDEDLSRLKTLLEIGKTSVGHKAVIETEAPVMH